MEHKSVQNAFGMSAEEVAERIGDLRYDEAATLLARLAEKFKKDAVADEGRKRPRLSVRLRGVSAFLKLAAQETEIAWVICDPHMRNR